VKRRSLVRAEPAPESRWLKGYECWSAGLQPWGKRSLGQSDCIFRISQMCARSRVILLGVRVSQFLSVLLLLTTLTLTVCFGVAAWRQSAGRDVEFTATIPHRETGWRSERSN